MGIQLILAKQLLSKYQILQEKITNQERDLNELKSKVKLCTTVTPQTEATMKLLHHLEVCMMQKKKKKKKKN